VQEKADPEASICWFFKSYNDIWDGPTEADEVRMALRKRWGWMHGLLGWSEIEEPVELDSDEPESDGED